MIRLGLTGSIGMGKSTTAAMFAEFGCAIWDADDAVHRLYSKNGAAVGPIQRLFPEAVENNSVSRTALRRIIAKNDTAIRQLEEIVHPLVAMDRVAFSNASHAEVIVFDIPLLFENKLEDEFDKVICVSVDPKTQRARVLDRKSMSEADFERILSLQMPDEEKRAKADYVIYTETIESTREQVQRVIRKIREEASHA